MNTIKSTWYGWGVLCLAGGGAYYFAKQSINADRASRYDTEMKKQARLRRLENSVIGKEGFQDSAPKSSKKKSTTDAESGTHNHKGQDHAGSPSSEASEDMAPVGHAPESAEQQTREKSKYEAAQPYRSKKGDRFS